MMPILANLNSQCSNIFVDKIVLKKEIDISVLKQGFTIPRETTDIFGFFNGSYLKPGDSKQIVIIFNNNPYTVQVRNTDFNEKTDRYILTMQSKSDIMYKAILQNLLEPSFTPVGNI